MGAEGTSGSGNDKRGGGPTRVYTGKGKGDGLGGARHGHVTSRHAARTHPNASPPPRLCNELSMWGDRVGYAIQ